MDGCLDQICSMIRVLKKKHELCKITGEVEHLKRVKMDCMTWNLPFLYLNPKFKTLDLVNMRSLIIFLSISFIVLNITNENIHNININECKQITEAIIKGKRNTFYFRCY